MSNLIKSVYFNFNQDGKRVIDSDSQVEQFIPDIFRREEEEKENFTEFSALGITEGDANFQSGLQVVSMEELRQEERAKVEEEAEAQIEQLLAQAKEEAEAIINQAQTEAEVICQKAYEEGMEQGLLAGQQAAQEELEQKHNEFQAMVQQRLHELEEQELALEPKFAEIMIALIEKITGIICKDKKEIIIYLIHQSLNQLERTHQVTLRVSKEDILLVSARKKELKEAVAEDVEFDIVEDESLEHTQCIIETENKIIDCSLNVQIKNLQDQIRMLTLL